MYTFKKGSDIAQINNNKVHLHLSIDINEAEGVYLIDIPSLNISSYTEKKENIEKRIDESVSSFFKYWIKIEGVEKFIDYMSSLGFELSSSKTSLKKEEKKQFFKHHISKPLIKIKGKETKRIFDEDLVIA